MVGFLRYCVFGLLSLSVLTAHAQRTVIPNPSEFVRTYGAEPFQFSDSRNWNATISTQSGARVNVPVVSSNGYTPARIANAVKNLIKSHPLKIAGTGVGLYLINKLPGASFDPITGQPLFTQTGSIMPMGSGPSDYFWMAQENPFPRSSSVEGACRAFVATKSSGQILRSHTVSQQSGGGTCTWGPATMDWITYNTSISRHGTQCPTGGTLNAAVGACFGITQTPLTPAQLDQVVSHVPTITPQHWADLGPLIFDNIPATFDGPDFQAFSGPPSIDLPSTTTTSTNPSTGQTTVVESLPSIKLDYSSSPNSITSTPTTVTNTYQNGSLTNTSTSTTNTTTTTTPTPAPEIPTDCEFMPTVCAFIEWYRQPFDEEEPDLSELITDEDFEKEITFASNATCPPPANIDTAFGSYALSYEPGCQWASMIKPFILIAALISAIYISLGSYRGGY